MTVKITLVQQLPENKDTLPGCEYKILQNCAGFKYGIDAVLLADFAKVSKDRIICDLCTGTGVIPLLLAAKNKTAKITGIEIQKDVCDIARKNVLLNNLSDRLEMIEGDVKSLFDKIPKNTFDTVTVNPPYMKASTAVVNAQDSLSIARHEILCTLEDVVKCAAGLLHSNGKFFMIHKPQRLSEIVTSLKENKLEPKRIQFVHPSAGKKATMVLMEAQKCAAGGLEVCEPLFVYETDSGSGKNEYSAQVKKIYGLI